MKKQNINLYDKIILLLNSIKDYILLRFNFKNGFRKTNLNKKNLPTTMTSILKIHLT